MTKNDLTVALTGASGNMGAETLRQLLQSDAVATVRILLLPNGKERAYAKRLKKKYAKKLEILFGDVSERATARALADGADYFVNAAAVIPPLADKRPDLADRCNRLGAEAIADAIAELGTRQPKLVHISTVALYGHRNYLHPWARVGDPLMPSVYDYYAVSKLKGERYVLESEVKNFVVLRQTGILHENMLKNNMHDGLMFHTGFNVPLEWVSARDSGILIRNLIELDLAEKLPAFWNQVYNVGGGAENRCTGYDTFEKGFRLIGGSTEKFMKPGWNSIRNFHGVWFWDGDLLNEKLGYLHDTVESCWRAILKKYPYYRLARLLPAKLVKKLFVERLLGDENAPARWIQSGDAGRIRAFFGSRENIEKMPSDWKRYPVLAKGELADASVDYTHLRDVKNAERSGFLLNHGYNDRKPDAELKLSDVREAAAFRGGKCLSETMTPGDLTTRLLFECHDGHRFTARPYTVLKAGFWCPVCCEPAPWDFDRLAKRIPFFAQIWYDTHAKNEDFVYGDGKTEAAADQSQKKPFQTRRSAVK